MLALMRASELELTAPANDHDLHVSYREFRGEFTEFGVGLPSGRTIRVRRRSSEKFAEGDPVGMKVRGGSRIIVFPRSSDVN